MVSPSIDRRLGLVGNTALKAPCDLATTGNITLSAEQSIDGTTTSASRVFVKHQTTTADNGIYDTSSGSWTRALDFNGAFDVVTGTIITVTGGATNSHTAWLITNTGTITLGTTGLTFASAVFSDSSSVGFLQAGTGAVARTAQAKMRETISPRDFGAVLDGSTDDYTAMLATFVAANGTGLKIIVDGPACKIGTSLSQNNHAHYDVDWGGCQVSFIGGAGTYLFDQTQAGRINHIGGVFTGNTNNHFVKTAGSAAAQAVMGPSTPSESLWTRQCGWFPKVVTGFATVFDFGNFSRELTYSGDITGNTTAVKCTGKVVNLTAAPGTVLYSAIASSQAVLVRGDAGDATYRYAEGLMFSNCIADTQGTAVDVRDVFVFRWNGGQIKSPSGTVGLDITSGVCPLTRDLFVSDVLMDAGMRVGNGLGAPFQFQVKCSNLVFSGVAGNAIDIQANTKGMTVNGASFDGGTSTPRMFVVGATCTNIKLDGLVPDVSTYINAPTIASTSVAGVEAEFYGSFTPGIAFGGSSVGITYATQNGRYYYRGGMITGFFEVTLTNKGAAAGAVTITGLPFACGLLNGIGTVSKYSTMNTAFYPILDITVNTSVINVKTGGGGSEAVWGNADFANGSLINGSCSYPVS